MSAMPVGAVAAVAALKTGMGLFLIGWIPAHPRGYLGGHPVSGASVAVVGLFLAINAAIAVLALTGHRAGLAIAAAYCAYATAGVIAGGVEGAWSAIGLATDVALCALLAVLWLRVPRGERRVVRLWWGAAFAAGLATGVAVAWGLAA
jgi:hypothetical protein